MFLIFSYFFTFDSSQLKTGVLLYKVIHMRRWELGRCPGKIRERGSVPQQRRIEIYRSALKLCRKSLIALLIFFLLLLFQSQQDSLSPFQICDHVFKMLYVMCSTNQGRDLKLKMTFGGKLFSIDKSLK